VRAGEPWAMLSIRSARTPLRARHVCAGGIILSVILYTLDAGVLAWTTVIPAAKADGCTDIRVDAAVARFRCGDYPCR